MARILIKNGRVWDGERFLYADVLTDGAQVARMASRIDEPADLTYDAAGLTVSAGLVDAHTHLRGISTAKFGTQAEMCCLPFGVTAAADASGENGDGALLDSFLVKGAVFAKVGVQNGRADFTKTLDTLARFGHRAVGVKVYFDTAMSDLTDDTPLREACEFAHGRGLRVMVHCANSPVSMAQTLQVLGKGDILTHAFHGGIHTAAADGFESMRQAKARGVIIDAGLAGHVHTDFAVFGAAVRAGVLPDVISTDITRFSAFTRGGRYGMTTCMSVARTLGMDEADIFRAVTSAPARALGKAREWGYLREGGPADLAVLAFTDEGFSLVGKGQNRLSDTHGYRCKLTVCDGQVAYKD